MKAEFLKSVKAVIRVATCLVQCYLSAFSSTWLYSDLCIFACVYWASSQGKLYCN